MTFLLDSGRFHPRANLTYSNLSIRVIGCSINRRQSNTFAFDHHFAFDSIMTFSSIVTSWGHCAQSPNLLGCYSETACLGATSNVSHDVLMPVTMWTQAASYSLNAHQHKQSPIPFICPRTMHDEDGRTSPFAPPASSPAEDLESPHGSHLQSPRIEVFVEGNESGGGEDTSTTPSPEKERPAAPSGRPLPPPLSVETGTSHYAKEGVVPRSSSGHRTPSADEKSPAPPNYSETSSTPTPSQHLEDPSPPSALIPSPPSGSTSLTTAPPTSSSTTVATGSHSDPSVQKLSRTASACSSDGGVPWSDENDAPILHRTDSSTPLPPPRLERHSQPVHRVAHPGAYRVAGLNSSADNSDNTDEPQDPAGSNRSPSADTGPNNDDRNVPNNADQDEETASASTPTHSWPLGLSSQHSRSVDSTLTYLVEASLVEPPVSECSEEGVDATEESPTQDSAPPLAVVHAAPIYPPPASLWQRRRWCLGSLLVLAVAAIAVAVALGVTASLAANKAGTSGPGPSPSQPLDGSSVAALSPTASPTAAPSLPSAVQELLLQFRETLPNYTTTAIDQDSNSPQAKAFRWLSASSSSFLSNYDEIRWTQRFAMATFYYATGGDGWVRREGWLSDAHECTWYAESFQQTTCPGNGRDVIGITMVDNRLNGTLPMELGLLTSLLSLVTRSHPYLHGTIPATLATLTNLRRLLLDENALSGSIPSSLAQLAALENLAMYRNRLTSTIPAELYTNLTKLNQIWLYDNVLTGTIPTVLNGLRRLRVLELGANHLNGTLPTQLGRLTLLNYLSVFENELTGTLPTELGLLTDMTDLYLDHNHFNGTIPTELQSMSKAGSIVIVSNELTGTMPPEVCSLFNTTKVQIVVDCPLVECDCGCVCKVEDLDNDDNFIDDDDGGTDNDDGGSGNGTSTDDTTGNGNHFFLRR